MTCREFEHRASSLTLWELSRAQDPQVLGHAGECQKCAGWLQQQRMLAATMQTLQARTASCEAGPDAERALLRAFRQAPSETLPPEMARRVSPIAFSLSRFFEVGAYVAVGAAIVVALFLGVRLLEQRSVSMPVKSQVAQPSVDVPRVVANESVSHVHQRQLTAAQNNADQPRTRRVQSASKSSLDTAEPSQAGADAGYVALMFCDPLSCSSDTQVVRMELPSPGIAGAGGEPDTKMRIADVVVGYDGVVRAVRIVN